MSCELGTVYIVDDDLNVCRALERLLTAADYEPVAFTSAQEFLAAHDPERAGCLILDVALPGCCGLEVQRALNESQGERPTIFLSGCGSIPISVQAMRAGAVNFLTKPVREHELLPAVREAISLDRAWRRTREARAAARARIASLTPRERQVLEYIIEGRLNKQIAARLGTVLQTVKVHRGRVMKKMGARSVAELVRFAANAESRPKAASSAYRREVQEAGDSAQQIAASAASGAHWSNFTAQER